MEAFVPLNQDGSIRKQIIKVGNTSLDRPFDGDTCAISYTLKYAKPPFQTVDTSIKPGSSKEVVNVTLGVGALLHAVEIVLKSMSPGEQSRALFDIRAVPELKDMIMENLLLEIELKCILGDVSESNLNLAAFQSFSQVMDSATQKKNLGNTAFTSGQYDVAIEFYDQGLQLLCSLQNLSPEEKVACYTSIITLHGNASNACTRAGQINTAIDHAQSALSILNDTPTPNHVTDLSKCYFRLGAAYEAANQFRASYDYYRLAFIQSSTAEAKSAMLRTKPKADQESSMPILPKIM